MRISQFFLFFVGFHSAFFSQLCYSHYNDKSECSDIRLDTPGRSMEKILPQNQTSESICYAYSAVDLIEAYRGTHAVHNPGPPVSPFLLAIDWELNERNSARTEQKYQRDLAQKVLDEMEATRQKIGWAEDAANLCRDVIAGKLAFGTGAIDHFRESLAEEEEKVARHTKELKELGKDAKEILKWLDQLKNTLKKGVLDRGGHVHSSIAHAIQKGACPQTLLGANILPFADASVRSLLEACYGDCRKTKLRQILYGKLDTEDPYLVFNSIETQFAHAAQGCLASRGVSAPILPSLSAIWEALSKDSAEDFIEALLSETIQNCHKKDGVKLALSDPTVKKIKSGVDIAATSKVAFDDPGTPDSKKLPFSISYCWTALVKGEKSYTNCEGEFHASTAIGRRFNAKTGQCQLLLQNHWGRQCAGIPNGWDCQGGKTWVDMEALGPISTTSTFLAP